MRLPGKKETYAGVPPNAPVTAFERARIEWFERYGSAVVDKNRAYVLTVVLTCGSTLIRTTAAPFRLGQIASSAQVQ